MSQPIEKREIQAGVNVRRTALIGGSAVVLVAVAAAGVGFLAIPGGKPKPPRTPRPQAALQKLAEVMLSEEPVEAAPSPREAAVSASTEGREEGEPSRGCPSGVPRVREEKPQVAYLTPEASVKPPVSAPAPTVAAAPTPPKQPIKRLNKRSADELRQELDRVNELAIGNKSARVIVIGQSNQGSPEQLTRHLLNTRADLIGLPATMGNDCKLEAVSAQVMQALSREVRRGLVTKDPVAALRVTLTKPEFQQESAIPCLCQMLSVGEPAIRQTLVEQLAGIHGRTAGEALAKLALYDLAPEIREQAIEALKDKPGVYYRPVLLAGFRHPWPTVAEHAAEALVALGDRANLSALNELEKLPDPRLPVPDPEKGHTVLEMVRINHLRNCTLCHAPSQNSSTDLVRGRMPQPGQPLPPPSVYYEDSSPGIFVRADMTYLRQDFSVMQSVSNPKPWPEWQRYDYVVRQRPVSNQEATWLLWSPHRRGSEDYPQRDAVRFAIKELMAWYSF